MAAQTKTKQKTLAKSASAKKTPAKAAQKKPAASQAGKKAAVKGSGAKAEAAKRSVDRQHREVWVVITFFLSLVSIFAVFNVKGYVLEALASFYKGLFGVGAYVLPFSLLLVCGTILFAKGKPIAGRIVVTMLIPVMVGMLVHLAFAEVALTEHVIPTLYATGATWQSGGVISGGIAALMEAALSNVGAMLISALLFAYLILNLMHIKMRNILEFFIGVHEKAELRRSPVEFYDEAYEEDEEAARIAIAPLPPKRIKLPRQERQDRKAAIDLPLDAHPPVLDATPEAGSETRTEQAPPKSAVLPWEEQIHKNPQPSDAVAPAGMDIAYESGEQNYADVQDDAAPFPLDPEEDDEAFSASAYEAMPLVEDIATQTLPLETLMPGMEPEVLDTHQIFEDGPPDEEALRIAQETAKREYDFPPISLLNEEVFVPADDVTEELRVRSHKLADTLSSFGVEAQIINVIRGPSITRYEILLDRGVKFSRLTTLQDDIALALGASGVRIAAIPDKSAVGIEVPNKVVQTVFLREVLTSRPMADAKSKLAFAIGKEITGTSIIGDIAKMPHMLIAGTTGSGKSVCINSIIISLLYRASPSEVKLIMIDPKMVELGNYNGIPHLLVPVVTDYKKAAGALNWAVVEMERRYKLMFEYGVKDLDSFNKVAAGKNAEPLPRIVIIIDELADLMMMAAKEIEESVCRIAQKARAAGMHLIIATQRPSADVLTGLMKSNIPSRIAFAVASQMESRIILDTGGADKLIGKGDMLFSPMGIPKPIRIQGCYLSSSEVDDVIEYVKRSGFAEYSDEILAHMERTASEDKGGAPEDEEEDELLEEAIDIVIQSGQASASLLQRKIKVGYARAARIIDQMESRGIIGPFDGAKPRQLLISRSDWQEIKARKSY